MVGRKLINGKYEPVEDPIVEIEVEAWADLEDPDEEGFAEAPQPSQRPKNNFFKRGMALFTGNE